MNINWNIIILLINFLILIVVLFVYGFTDPAFTKNLIFYVLLVTAFLSLLFILKYENNKHLKKSFLKHSNLVLISLLIVNFQKYLDYLLDYIYEPDLLLQVSQSSGTKTLIISLAGLICFFIGYLIKGSNKKKLNRNIIKVINTSFLSITSLAFLIGFLLTVNPAYVLGGYGIYDMGLIAVYFSILFKASYFALAIQKFINLKNSDIKVPNLFKFVKKMGGFNLLILSVYLLIVLLSGDRGDIISFSLLLLFGYMLVTGKKFNLSQSILMILIASTVITLLGVARSFNVDNNLSFTEKITEAINGDSNLTKVESILPATSELAGSVKALLYSVQYVPSVYDYFYGRFQLQALFSIVPFSNSLNEIFFSDNSSKNSSSDSYVTWLIEGDNPMTGHGTSILADFYLSFGIFGVLFGMVFFGWVVRYSEQQTNIQNSKALLGIIISAVIFCFSIYLARSSLFSLLRLIVWIWLLIKVNEWFVKRVKKNA